MREPREILSEAIDTARFTAKDMARAAGKHPVTLSKYVGPKASLEVDPVFVGRFIVRMTLALEQKIYELGQLREEIADLIRGTPEYEELKELALEELIQQVGARVGRGGVKEK